jgi:hypothetical protein
MVYVILAVKVPLKARAYIGSGFSSGPQTNPMIETHFRFFDKDMYDFIVFD